MSSRDCAIARRPGTRGRGSSQRTHERCWLRGIERDALTEDRRYVSRVIALKTTTRPRSCRGQCLRPSKQPTRAEHSYTPASRIGVEPAFRGEWRSRSAGGGGAVQRVVSCSAMSHPMMVGAQWDKDPASGRHPSDAGRHTRGHRDRQDQERVPGQGPQAHPGTGAWCPVPGRGRGS